MTPRRKPSVYKYIVVNGYLSKPRNYITGPDVTGKQQHLFLTVSGLLSLLLHSNLSNILHVILETTFQLRHNLHEAVSQGT